MREKPCGRVPNVNGSEKAKWHFGCGRRLFANWYNTDEELDLTRLPFPFKTGCFAAAIGQHVIEHLRLHDEVLPLFAELRRVIRKGGVLYLSCPDMEKICKAYCSGNLQELIDGRLRRFPPKHSLHFKGPKSHFVNELFYQKGEHKNLFDFELLKWALLQSGWTFVSRITEESLLKRERDVLRRDDEEQALYVAAE